MIEIEKRADGELTMIDICEHLRNIDQAQPGFVF